VVLLGIDDDELEDVFVVVDRQGLEADLLAHLGKGRLGKAGGLENLGTTVAAASPATARCLGRRSRSITPAIVRANMTIDAQASRRRWITALAYVGAKRERAHLALVDVEASR